MRRKGKHAHGGRKSMQPPSFPYLAAGSCCRGCCPGSPLPLAYPPPLLCWPWPRGLSPWRRTSWQDLLMASCRCEDRVRQPCLHQRVEKGAQSGFGLTLTLPIPPHPPGPVPVPGYALSSLTLHYCLLPVIYHSVSTTIQIPNPNPLCPRGLHTPTPCSPQTPNQTLTSDAPSSGASP